MKKLLITVVFFTVVFIPGASSQLKPAFSSQLLNFKTQLALINASFNLPEGAKEVKTPDNEKFPFSYGISIPDLQCEIWFRVSALKRDWLRFERRRKRGVNPDSLYANIATGQAIKLAGEGNFVVRNASNFLLTHYNADVGRSYFMTMAEMPETSNYQFGLMIVLQRNHHGTITALCMSNDKGPAFFRNLQKLQDCIKFNN